MDAPRPSLSWSPMGGLPSTDNRPPRHVHFICATDHNTIVADFRRDVARFIAHRRRCRRPTSTGKARRWR